MLKNPRLAIYGDTEDRAAAPLFETSNRTLCRMAALVVANELVASVEPDVEQRETENDESRD